MRRAREAGVGYPQRAEVGGWAIRARCRQPDAPEMHPTSDQELRDALRCCAHCPVRLACLDHALVNRERYGVWGGTSEAERRHLIRERRERREQAAELEAVG